MSLKQQTYVGPVVVCIDTRESWGDTSVGIKEDLSLLLSEQGESINYWGANKTYGGNLRPELQSIREQEGAVFFRPEEVELDLAAFERRFSAALDYLRSVSKAVMVRWGVISYWN